MKLEIDGKVYDAASIDALTLRDTMLLEVELAEAGVSRSWQSIRATLSDMQSMSTEQQQRHPEWLLVFSLIVWASRRAAGERVSFLDAIDVPAASIRVINVDDHQKPKGGGGAAGKARSGQGGGRRRRK